MTVYTFSSVRTLKGGVSEAALQLNERQPGEEEKNLQPALQFYQPGDFKAGGLEGRLFVQMFKEP